MRTLATAAATAAVVLAGTAVPAQASLPEGTVFGTGLPGAIPGRYIVTLDEPAGSDVSALSADGGATYVAEMSATEARRLAADPDVRFVEQDRILTLQATQNNPAWGLDRIDQRVTKTSKTFTPTDDGDSVHAYVLDTGIRVTHADFGGRASYGYDALSGTSKANDCNGHGTHVAGTVGGSQYGVAKAVRLIGVRVLNCSGSGTTAQVVAGINWVTANRVLPAVANMSLGGPVDATIDAAVQASIAAGITYGLAAGNENGSDACGRSPARVPEGITVGSTNTGDQRSSFSNLGSCLDIFGPGSGITSDWFDSDTATNTISGTSMATPHVVGAAALILAARPGWTPQQIRDQLINDATNGVINNAGAGSPNRLLFGSPNAPPTDDFSISVSPTSGSVTAGESTTATVSTATVSGNAHTIELSATGVPNGATASVRPGSVSSGESATLTVDTTAATRPGTYTISVVGKNGEATHSFPFTLTVTAITTGCTITNDTNVPIPDAGPAIFSDIAITGCDRPATATAKVEVHIKHTYRGDLRIDLVAPDGTTYRLKNISFFDGTDNVDTTYTVNLSGKAAEGTWRLKVQDLYTADTGFIDSWTLAL